MKGVVRVAALLVAGIGVDCGESGNHRNASVQEVNIRVEGARCEMCARSIAEAVESIEGVESVNVDLEKKVATVEYIPDRTDIASLETAIANAGYDANDAKRNQQAYEALPSCCQ
jgi:periplasmic mercuric ion binding protein